MAFFKVYAKKGQQQNLRQLRLLTYVGRPNNNINEAPMLQRCYKIPHHLLSNDTT